IAVDASDRPWISFVDSTDQQLRIGYYDGTAWQFQTIDSGSTFRDTSIAIDSLGNPHIAYYDYGSSGARQDLKYAAFDGTNWSITTVDDFRAGEHNTLVLDSQDRPRIAYVGLGATKYAWYDGHAWTIDFVAPQANYPSLALDQNGRPMISYYNTIDKDLMVASRPMASISENGGNATARL